jgi:hypothetical protein
MSAIADDSSGRKIAFASRATFSPLPNGVRLRRLRFRARYSLISTRDCTLGMNALTRIRSRATDRAHSANGAHEFWLGMTHRQSPLKDLLVEHGLSDADGVDIDDRSDRRSMRHSGRSRPTAKHRSLARFFSSSPRRRSRASTRMPRGSGIRGERPKEGGRQECLSYIIPYSLRYG